MMLQQKLQIISITTLSIGVVDITTNITQSPDGCLSELAAEEYETLIRTFLLHDFMGPPSKNPRKKLGEKELICNMHLRRQDSYFADLYYECCHVTKDGDIKCKEMVTETLMNILFVCVFLFNVIALMYVPMIFPKSYFKEKFRTYDYEHVLKEPVSILVKKERIYDKNRKSSNIVPLSTMCSSLMPKFASTLDAMEEGNIYKLQLSKIEFRVKAEQLVGKAEAPVGVLTSLYDALILCKIRQKNSVKACCNSNIFGPSKCCCMRREYKWYKCLRGVMYLTAAALICTPWVARVIIYYVFEHSNVVSRTKMMASYGMIEPYTGNLVSYLTPVHVIFIICYVILVLDGIFLGLLSKHVSRILQMVIRKCFRDMYQSSRTRAFGWFVRLLIKPFTYQGIFGLLLMPIHFALVFPFGLGILSLYFLPTLNISLRLFVHFLAYCVPYHRKIVKKAKDLLQIQYLYSYYDLDYLLCKEKLERPESILMQFRLTQIVIILICMVTVLSFALLAMECIVFFAEYIIYSVIGIILNASFALKYVSFFFMIIIYANECFGGVTKKYSSYNAYIHDFVLEKVKNEIKEVAAQDKEEQKNTAFTLPASPEPLTRENEDKIEMLKTKTDVFLFCCVRNNQSVDTLTQDNNKLEDTVDPLLQNNQENRKLSEMKTEQIQGQSEKYSVSEIQETTEECIPSTRKTLNGSKKGMKENQDRALAREDKGIPHFPEPLTQREQEFRESHSSLTKAINEIKESSDILTHPNSKASYHLTHEAQASESVVQRKEESDEASEHSSYNTRETLKECASPKVSLIVEEGVPQWKTSHLIVFLDREDTSYLTNRFFFDIVNMPHSGSPGNLLSNIVSAFAQLMVIIIFLLFVILIVMVFGDEYNVSGFNQMIATLVTGFLPWVFINILFKPNADLSVDTENINFQNSFEDVVRKYKQSWELSDLPVDRIEKISHLNKECGVIRIVTRSEDENCKDETYEMNDTLIIKDSDVDLIINSAMNLNKALQFFKIPVNVKL